MRRRARVILNLTVIAVLAGTLFTVLAPAAPAGSPYLSALSYSFGTPALAASGCEYKDCAGGSRHNIVCAKVAFPAISCFTYHGTCLTRAC